ncbi:MAG: FtsX-like permease family protein [Opitutaceae bacterium]
MNTLIAWRNLWRNSRRTLVILSAVAVGVWSMVFFSAFMRGMVEDMVQSNIVNLTGHLQVQAPGYFENPVIDYRIHETDPVSRALREILPAGSRWTSRVRSAAVIRSARHTGGITLVGIDPAREAGLSFIGTAPIEGSNLAGAPHGILIGKALADRLEARVGHRLVIDAQNATGEIESQAFTIVGVFRAQMEMTEKQFVFALRPTVQAMLAINGDVTEFSIVLPLAGEAENTARALRAELPESGFRILTWRELVPFIGVYLDSMNVYSLIWNLVVFIAMAFGLVNTILMAVFERIREFGLVRALGVTPGGIIRGVILETAMLLVVGLGFGIALGAASIALLSQTGIDFSAFAAGSEYFGVSRVIYPRDHLFDYALAGSMVVTLGLLVSLYPAIKAGRISPVDAMTRF